MTRIYQAILVFCFVLCIYILPSQASETGRIYGNVVAKYAGYSFYIESAKVTIRGGENGIQKTTTSDDDGAFEFTDLPSGTYNIKVKKTSCKLSKKTVLLEDGEEKDVTIEVEDMGGCDVEWGGDSFIKISNELDTKIKVGIGIVRLTPGPAFGFRVDPGTCWLIGARAYAYKYQVTIQKLPKGSEKIVKFKLGKNKTQTIRVTESFF